MPSTLPKDISSGISHQLDCNREPGGYYWGGIRKRKEAVETDSCSQLTFGTVVLLFWTLAPLPPPPLQYLQPVILLQLEDGQRDLISERRACKDDRKGRIKAWKG